MRGQLDHCLERDGTSDARECSDCSRSEKRVKSNLFTFVWMQKGYHWMEVLDLRQRERNPFADRRHRIHCSNGLAIERDNRLNQ
jgi:hypothetical protein